MHDGLKVRRLFMVNPVCALNGDLDCRQGCKLAVAEPIRSGEGFSQIFTFSEGDNWMIDRFDQENFRENRGLANIDLLLI